MRTVVVGTRPPELDALIARRRSLGLDLFDEVWNGEHHMNPAPHSRHGQVEFQLAVLLAPIAAARGLVGTGIFNLGSPDDYRVPDMGFTRGAANATFLPSAELVVEIASPGDESLEKLGFYAARVREVLVVDPETRTVRAFHGMAEAEHSEVLGLQCTELAARISWPD